MGVGGGNTPRDKAASASLNSLLSEPPGKPLKNLPASVGDCERCGCDPWVGKIPWRRAWQPTPVFLPGEPHGQRSLVGYSPESHTEVDTIEVP